MFKVGERVVYIGIDEEYFGEILKNGEIYTISDIISRGGLGIVKVGGYFSPHSFINLSEYRKLKLKKIYENR